VGLFEPAIDGQLVAGMAYDQEGRRLGVQIDPLVRSSPTVACHFVPAAFQHLARDRLVTRPLGR
jgi:hypothetical protein